MSIGIYKITNKINGKSYIGQSTNIEGRFERHKNEKRYILGEAFNKYGIDNFNFEIIEECPKKELNEKEIFYIDFYNTITPFGYNIQTGGYGGEFFSYYDKKDFLEIVNKLKNTKIPMTEIAEEYSLSVRTIHYINSGKVHYNKNENYPLRNRRVINQKKYCIDCGKEISNDAIRCSDCAYKNMRKVERPTPLELAEKVVLKGFSAVGREYGVSYNAIKKWCVSYGMGKLKSEVAAWYIQNK